jgi:hypothetical protein
MKNKGIIYRIGALVLIGCAVIFSCKKDKEQPKDANGTVSFGINISNLKSAINLKATKLYSLNDVKNIVLTIQNSDGSATAYSSSKINILQMNGIFYSQKIALKVGSYKLTEFELLDASGNTIFAAPLAGSLQAQNVSNPLPVAFDVLKDEVTPVYVEVLSTENLTPEDFGLARFSFNEVKTFSFLIVVADSKKDEILSAKLTVSSGSYNYVQNLENIANNVVTIKDSLNEYTLNVTKPNYQSYIHTFTYDELKTYELKPGNLPLVVELDELQMPVEGLVAYYPFNGNANDESGNGYNGVGTNVVYANDVHGNINSSALFNGAAYIQLPSDFDLKERTISLMFKCDRFYNSTPYDYDVNNIFTSDHPGLIYGDHYFSIVNVSGQLTLQYASNVASWDITNFYSVNITTNQWYQASIAVSSQYIKYYFNGALVCTYNNTNPNYHSSSGINTVLLGTSRTAASRFLIGNIDEVRIYNRALTDSEIQLIYNNE